MSYQHILVDKNEGIMTLALNRPAVLNAFNADLLREIRDGVRAADQDDEVGVIILTGAGRGFSAGVDLKFLGSPEGQTLSHTDFTNLARETLAAIEGASKPVIAAVNGFAFTGALELVLACDIVIAGESTRFGDTHAKFGLTPVWGGSQRLPRLVGAMKAREILFTSEAFSAQEAAQIGLVNRVVPDDQLIAAARQMAAKIAANSRGSIKVLKRLVNEGLKVEMGKGMTYEDSLSEPVPDREARVNSFKAKK